MSRRTTRKNAKPEDLVEELAIGAAIRMRTDSDAVRPVVVAVVQYLVDEYPTQDLYIPAQSAAIDIDAIRADIDDGMSMRQVCAKYHHDRRTIYALLDSAHLKENAA